jgi:hypothetical protein
MQRPTTITVFGVLNIVFAAMGMLGILATMALFSVAGASNNPVVSLIRENPAYAAWMKLSIALSVPTLVALLAAGIGLLLLKEWARILSIIYAIAAIIFGLIGVAMNFIFLLRPLLGQAAGTRGPAAAGAFGGAIGASFGGCFGLIYPVLLLIFMTRPKITAAFRAAAEPPPLPSA